MPKVFLGTHRNWAVHDIRFLSTVANAVADASSTIGNSTHSGNVRIHADCLAWPTGVNGEIEEIIDVVIFELPRNLNPEGLAKRVAFEIARSGSIPAQHLPLDVEVAVGYMELSRATERAYSD
jgi:hypothetical protein